MAIDQQRVGDLRSAEHESMACDEILQLDKSVNELITALVGDVPWDWRYNATYWAQDAADLCLEIAHSIAWMRAYAKYASECEDADQRLAEGLVSYYADNAATRVGSCRDKIALVVWSYYCPFNPDKRSEVLTFLDVHERLTMPIRFGLRLDGHESFLHELNKLTSEDFKEATEYRHKKIHRMEPRVMLREPTSHDHPSYMFALATKKDIEQFDKKLEEMYPDDTLRAVVRESCVVDGVLFDRRPPKQLRWHFEQFDRFTYACWRSLCDATAGSIEILLARDPMQSKDKPSGDF